MKPIPVRDASIPYSQAQLLATLGISQTASTQGASAGSSSAPGSQGPDLWQVCVDGERTAHMVSLMGKWYAEERTEEEVKLLALGWNSRNNPPLPEHKVLATATSMYQTHTRKNPTAAARAPLQPLFDLADAEVATLLQNDLPDREWLLTGVLPLGRVGALVATGGTGKSQLLLQLGVSVATGHPLCEQWNVGETGSALLLFAEDDRDDVHRRLHVIRKRLCVSVNNFDKDAGQRLLIPSIVARNNQLTRALPRSGVEPTDYIDRLQLVMQQIKDLRLVVFDPASRFRGGIENSAEDVTRFVEQLERVAKETGVTVLVAHHARKGTSKADEPTQDHARGSSALSDGVRWQMNLGPLVKELTKKHGVKAEEGYRYLFAKVTKTNYSPPVDGVVLYRSDGGYLTTKVLRTLEDRIVDLIKQQATQGRTHTANRLEDEFGGEKGPLTAGKGTVRKAISELVDGGHLRKGKGGKLEVEPLKNLPAEYEAALAQAELSRFGKEQSA